MDFNTRQSDGEYVVEERETGFTHTVTSVNPEMVESGDISRETAWVYITREAHAAWKAYQS